LGVVPHGYGESTPTCCTTAKYIHVKKVYEEEKEEDRKKRSETAYKKTKMN